jgi:sialic acid synthase SpsE
MKIIESLIQNRTFMIDEFSANNGKKEIADETIKAAKRVGDDVIKL